MWFFETLIAPHPDGSGVRVRQNAGAISHCPQGEVGEYTSQGDGNHPGDLLQLGCTGGGIPPTQPCRCHPIPGSAAPWIMMIEIKYRNIFWMSRGEQCHVTGSGVEMLLKPRNNFMQIRKFALDGFPDNFHVDLKIAMGQRVAHFVGDAER
jgi:hypothetical protein